jgi:hypothetical protein
MSARLAFGYNQGLPEDVAAAWGCRAIVTQDGGVDVLWDRTSVFGPDDAVDALVNQPGVCGVLWRERAGELLASGRMLTGEAGEHQLINDGVLVVKGNTNASGGHLYVCAYLVAS